MSTRGLWKLTAVANNLQAWEDWGKLAQKAILAGVSQSTIDEIAPDIRAGWRTIDKCIAKLREAIAQQGATP